MDSSFFPCRTSTISKVGRLVALFFYPFVGIGVACLLFPLLYEIIREKHTVLQLMVLFLTVVCVISLSAFFLHMSRKCYIMESRYVVFDQYGFEFGYGKNGTGKRYEWQKVDEIGIIAYAASASKQNYQTQICIFLKPVNDMCLRKLRDSYLYGVFNLNDFVLLDYDLLVIEKLNKCKSPSIHDLRIKQMTL